MDLNFEPETRGGLSNEIARWMGIDGQDAFRGAHEKVMAISVHYIDDHDNERPLTEIKDNELNNQAGLDTIIRILESAVMRDAMTRFGIAWYVLYFHLAGGQVNRGRYPFQVPGSGHMYRNNNSGSGSGNSAYGMVRRGAGGGEGFGSPTDMMMTQDAMKLVPQLLGWSTEERRVNDERTAIAFKTQQETIKMQATIIESFNDREMRIRELENVLLDRKYEIEKKRKKDEDSEKRWSAAWKLAEQYGLPLGAMLVPPFIELIRKLNAGPNYVPNEMNFDKVQEIIKQAQSATQGEPGDAPRQASGMNGSNGAPPNGAPQNGAPPPNGAPTSEHAAAGAAGGMPEGNPLDGFHKRIAFDLVRFMGLIRMKGHVDTLRDALDEGPIIALYDEIVQVTVTADASDENVMKIAQLALQFGSALMQRQDIALKLFMSVDGFERESMHELMELLKQYAMFVQQLAAQQGAPPVPPAG